MNCTMLPKNVPESPYDCGGGGSIGAGGGTDSCGGS